jgi:hypothetical protein
MGQTNVIAMPSRANATKSLPLVLPLDSLDHTAEALLQVEVTVELAQRMLDKREEVGDEVVLHGIREIFLALSALLAPALVGLAIALAESVDPDGICSLIV